MPRAAFLVQKEVAERIVAGPGDPGYGSFSVLVACYARASVLGRVRPGSFRPPPKVESAFVGLELHAPPLPPAEMPAFLATVRLAFGQRRKTLRNALAAGWGREEAERALAAAGLPPAPAPRSWGSTSSSRSTARRRFVESIRRGSRRRSRSAPTIPAGEAAAGRVRRARHRGDSRGAVGRAPRDARLRGRRRRVWNRFSGRGCRGAGRPFSPALVPALPALRQGMVYGPFDTNVLEPPWATSTADARPTGPRTRGLNDVTLQLVPWQAEARRQLLGGRVPLSQSVLGRRAAAPRQRPVGAVQSRSLLALPFEARRAQSLRAFLKMLLALAAPSSPRASSAAARFALPAAVAYAYGGSLAVWQLFPHAEVMALFPFAFLASERLLAAPGGAPRAGAPGPRARRDAAGHPETALAGDGALGLRWVIALVGRRVPGDVLGRST